MVVTVEDEMGRFVPHANPTVAVAVTGPARLLGLENGDPMDTTNYRLPQRRAFNGMLLAILQTKTQAGKITIRACAEGLNAAECEL
jgi:beta-galactosidase